MLNLAFIGSITEAERYGSIINRINGAKWFAFVPVDGDDAVSGKDQLGATVAEASIEALLTNHRNEVDAIVAHASSEHLQDFVKTADQANRPILVGPLLAKTGEDFKALTQKLAHRALVTACPWRFMPAIQSVKASIVTGKLGEIGLIRMHRWHSKITEKTSDISDRIIPVIDIALWLFGEQPTKIFSLRSGSVNDYVQLHLKFENNGMVVIDDTGALPEGGDYFSLSVIGAKGAAYADDHRNMNLIVDGVYPHAIRSGQGNIHIASQVQEFVNLVRDKSPFPVVQQDVLNVLQVSDAALATMAINKVSVWKDGKYEPH